MTAERLEYPDDHLATLPSRYAAVTEEDVQRVAREQLFPESCVVSAAGPVTLEGLQGVMGAVR